jgi:hypothetical protein
VSDMTQVIIPKSDQINADDFLGGPRSYVIESVAITGGTEQPVSIKLAGENRVWRPCKSMSRVLVAAWGADAKAYAGRSVTLYRDPAVKWAGIEVGGIRISHMSHLERDMLIQLTATKGKRSPHVIKPLAAPRQGPDDALRREIEELLDRLAGDDKEARKQFIAGARELCALPARGPLDAEGLTALRDELAKTLAERAA